MKAFEAFNLDAERLAKLAENFTKLSMDESTNVIDAAKLMVPSLKDNEIAYLIYVYMSTLMERVADTIEKNKDKL